MIKLGRISIEAFRGISGRLDIDLSAPITLIYAPNGVGKTSICDAAEWLLTGAVKRLEDSGAGPGDLRCDFSSPDRMTCVSGSMLAYGQPIDVEKFVGSCRWRKDNDDFKGVSQSELLETLAPSAVEANVHKTHANHSRQIWLRGTRFLSGDSLAALLESDADSIGNRERLFADMLGVGHLIETERQLESYSKAINQYVKQQQTLLDNRHTALRQRQANIDTEARESEKTLLPHALDKASEALSLLQAVYAMPKPTELSVSNMRRAIAFARGELERRKSTWNERRTAEVSLAADWSSRFILEERNSVDQNRALALTELIAESAKDAEALQTRSQTIDQQMKLISRNIETDQSTCEQLRTALTSALPHIVRYATFSRRPALPFSDAVKLITAVGSTAARQLQVLENVRQQLPGKLRDAEELKLLRNTQATARAEAPTVETKQQAEDELVSAETEVISLRRDYDRAAGPIDQLKRLSGSVVDMLSHAKECPVCAHDWGSAETLRQALAAAREIEPYALIALAKRLEQAESVVRLRQDTCAHHMVAWSRVAEIDAQIISLEKGQANFLENITSLGLAAGGNLGNDIERLGATLSLVQVIAPITRELTRLDLPDLSSSLNLTEYVGQAIGNLEQRIEGMTTEVETLRKNRMILAVELDGLTRGRQAAEAEQLALQKKIENTAFRLQALRSAWRILAQDRSWSNEALSELSARLLRENSDLLQVEQLIDQSGRLTESAASLGEIAQLQAELAPIELERDRLNGYALAAEATQTAYQKKRQQHVRQQMEEFVRVISALFTRMQANEVYDKIMEGDASAPLSWRAISEGLAMNPDLRFSQGQRQDFALAIFLARARGLSGTFFLDEPLVHLDDLNRVALLDVFRAICLERAGNVSFVLTTASQPTLRHFVEKFARVSQSSPGHDNRTPVLRVVSLEGNPRAGVSFS